MWVKEDIHERVGEGRGSILATKPRGTRERQAGDLGVCTYACIIMMQKHGTDINNTRYVS